MSRTEYNVSIVVVSRSASLRDLEARIGARGEDGSHSVGDAHVIKSRGLWQSSVWQIGSSQPRDSDLEVHFEDILRKIPASTVVGDGTLPSDAETYISVGVFSDRQIPTADLTRRCVAIAEDFRAGIEVRFYMPDMG